MAFAELCVRLFNPKVESFIERRGMGLWIGGWLWSFVNYRIWNLSWGSWKKLWVQSTMKCSTWERGIFQCLQVFYIEVFLDIIDVVIAVWANCWSRALSKEMLKPWPHYVCVPGQVAFHGLQISQYAVIWFWQGHRALLHMSPKKEICEPL